MNFVKRFLQEGDTLVDVGSNVGTYALLAASRPGVSVIAFEPSTAARELLEENVRLNGLEDRVEVSRFALGSVAGTALLTTSLGTTNRVVGTDATSIETEGILVRTLDDELRGGATQKVAILKIDVEGHELEVLAGATEVLARDKPAIIAEANDREGLERWLIKRGYALVKYVVEENRLEPETAVSDSMNLIAVPDVEVAQTRLSGRHAVL